MTRYFYFMGAHLAFDLPVLHRPHGKRPVILQIIPELGPGGAEQGCVDMAAAIIAAGGLSLVASHGGSKARLHELARAKAVHVDLPVHSKNPFVIWRNIARIEKLIRDYQVDIVHVRSRAPAWSARAACARTGAYFMTTCHAPYNTQNKFKHRYNSAIAAGARVIAISEYVANYLRTTYGVSDDRIRLVHRGVALDRFSPAAVTPDRLIKMSEAWRIPDGATVILLPGRLTRWKGQHVLIDALSKIDRPDLFTVFIGSDQGRHGYTQELHDHIRRANLEGRVRIVDHTDDMPAAYMAAHIVVSASTDPEGFGRIATEGQAMGRIVIATNHGGSCETIIDGVTGYLVTPGNADDLARGIKTALSLDINSRAQMGNHAMHHIAQNFSRENMIAQTISIYNELLGIRR